MDKSVNITIEKFPWQTQTYQEKHNLWFSLTVRKIWKKFHLRQQRPALAYGLLAAWQKLGVMTLDWMMLGPRHGAGNSRCRSVVGGKIPSSIRITFFQNAAGKNPSFRRNIQLSNKAHECGQSCDNISTIKTFLRHHHIDFLLLLGDVHIYTRNGGAQHVRISHSCL